jgi:uncharacterized protein YjbJ (UPF0337 family)
LRLHATLQSSGRADKICGTAQQIIGKMMGGGDLVIKGAARKESGKAELAAAKAKKEAEKHGSGESAADSGNKTQDGMNTLVLLLLHLVPCFKVATTISIACAVVAVAYSFASTSSALQ